MTIKNRKPTVELLCVLCASAVGFGQPLPVTPQPLRATDSPTFAGLTLSPSASTGNIYRWGSSAYGTTHGNEGTVGRWGFHTYEPSGVQGVPWSGRGDRAYAWGYNIHPSSGNGQSLEIAGEPGWGGRMEDNWVADDGSTYTPSSKIYSAGPNETTVTLPSASFAAVNEYIYFTTSQNSYRIKTRNSSTEFVVHGNCSGETGTVRIVRRTIEQHVIAIPSWATSFSDANRIISTNFETERNRVEISMECTSGGWFHLTDGKPFLGFRETVNGTREVNTEDTTWYSRRAGGSTYRWFNHSAATEWGLGDASVYMLIIGSTLDLGHTSIGPTNVRGTSVTIGNASFPTTITGSTITVADGKLERADFASETGVYPIPFSMMRQNNGASISTSTTTSNLGIQCEGIAGGGYALIGANATSTTVQTNRCQFHFGMPPEYVAGSAVTLRVYAHYEQGGNAPSTRTIDAVAYELGTAPLSASSVLSSGPQTMSASSTAYDFSLTPTNIAPGDLLEIWLETKVNDGSGSGPNYATVGRVEIRTSVKG